MVDARCHNSHDSGTLFARLTRGATAATAIAALALGGCGGDAGSEDSVATEAPPREAEFVKSNSCGSTAIMNENTCTYGEVRSWVGFSNPSWLADAKKSLGAACTQATCCCRDGSSDTGANLAAWNTIKATSGGADKSAGANQMCVGAAGVCANFVSCLNTATGKTLSRALSGPTLSCGSATQVLRFGYDPLANGNCKLPLWNFDKAQVCANKSGPSANYSYTCVGESTTFKKGSQAVILARFTNLTVNHRFRVVVSKDGAVQPNLVPDSAFNQVDQYGWVQAYTWPTLTNLAVGKWSADISIGDSSGAWEKKATVAFTVTN